MELRWLRTFLAIAEHLNYARAAEALHVSQPAVSQQIRTLEQSVGVRLVERGSRPIRLTRAGQALLPFAVAALDAADGGVRAARNSQLEDHGIVRFGVAGSMANRIIADVARQVRDEYPGIEVTFRAGLKSGAVIEMLSTGQLDVGLTAENHLPPELVTEVVESAQLGLLVAEDHPLAREAHTRLADHTEDGFVFISEDAGLRLRDVGFEACRTAGFRPRVVQEAPDTLTTFGLVAAGVGICIAPAAFAHAVNGTVFVACTDVTTRLRTLLLWRRDDEYGALRLVLTCIRHALRQAL